MKEKKKYFKYLLVLFLAINVSVILFGMREKLLGRDYWQRFPEIKKDYYNSQYATKKYTLVLSDKELYSYAGGVYLRGLSPIFVNPEHPPLGKYIVSLSILLFNNEALLVIIIGLLSPVVLFLLSKQVLGDTTYSLIPPVLFTFEPLFKFEIKEAPLLELLQLVFVLFIFYFFNKYLKKGGYKNILAISVFLGFLISTKFFITGVLVMGVLFATLIFQKKVKSILPIIASLPISIAILLASYFRMFQEGASLRQVVAVQKWIYWYQKGHIGHYFSFIPLILFDRLQTWWGSGAIIKDAYWTPVWSVIFVFSILVITYYLLGKIKRNKEIEVLITWVILYSVFLAIGEASSRYFLLLLPFLYVISTFGLILLAKRYK